MFLLINNSNIQITLALIKKRKHYSMCVEIYYNCDLKPHRLLRSFPFRSLDHLVMTS